MPEKDNYYTVREAAVVLGRTVQTIYKWLALGKLSGLQNPFTGRIMVLREDVIRAKEWA